MAIVQSSNPNPTRNVVEAEMCRNLANYLVMQGQYRASEVSKGGMLEGGGRGALVQALIVINLTKRSTFKKLPINERGEGGGGSSIILV